MASSAVMASLPAVSATNLITGVNKGAETYGSAADLGAYQLLNNVGVPRSDVQAIFASQKYLVAGIKYMAKIFGSQGTEEDREEFRQIFGTGPQAAVKCANMFKESAESWGKLSFGLRAPGQVRADILKMMAAGSGPGKNFHSTKQAYKDQIQRVQIASVRLRSGEATTRAGQAARGYTYADDPYGSLGSGGQIVGASISQA